MDRVEGLHGAHATLLSEAFAWREGQVRNANLPVAPRRAMPPSHIHETRCQLGLTLHQLGEDRGQNAGLRTSLEASEGLRDLESQVQVSSRLPSVFRRTCGSIAKVAAEQARSEIASKLCRERIHSGMTTAQGAASASILCDSKASRRKAVHAVGLYHLAWRVLPRSTLQERLQVFLQHTGVGPLNRHPAAEMLIGHHLITVLKSSSSPSHLLPVRGLQQPRRDHHLPPAGQLTVPELLPLLFGAFASSEPCSRRLSDLIEAPR